MNTEPLTVEQQDQQDALEREQHIAEIGRRLSALAENLQRYAAERRMADIDVANCFVAVGMSGLITLMGNAEAARWLRYLADEVEQDRRPGH